MKTCEKCNQPLPETMEEKLARLEKEIAELKARPAQITIFPQPYYPYNPTPHWQEYTLPWGPNTSQTWCDTSRYEIGPFGSTPCASRS